MFNFFLLIFFSLVLFLISLLGLFSLNKNIIILLLSLELMLLSINLNYIFFSVYLDDVLGQMFSIFILTIAASESAIGLALLVIYYRIKGVVSLSIINSLKS